MNTTVEFLNSPFVVAVVTVALAACVTIAGAVIGLFIKVSSMSANIQHISTTVQEIQTDKDLMRWSQWGPAHESELHGKPVERHRS